MNRIFCYDCVLFILAPAAVPTPKRQKKPSTPKSSAPATTPKGSDKKEKPSKSASTPASSSQKSKPGPKGKTGGKSDSDASTPHLLVIFHSVEAESTDFYVAPVESIRPQDQAVLTELHGAGKKIKSKQ